MAQRNEWEARLQYLLRLADEASAETIEGLGLTEEVKRAEEEREDRIDMAAELLEPLGIDLRALLRKHGYSKPSAKRQRRARKSRSPGQPRRVDISEAEEPYRTVAGNVLRRAPEGASAQFELYGRRHVLVLRRGQRQVRVVCRYYNRKRGHGNWWYTASDQDLRDTDFLCFILCDEHGRFQQAAVVPTSWLNENKHRLARCEDRGYHVYIFERPEGLVIRRSDWSENLAASVNNWEMLWAVLS